MKQLQESVEGTMPGDGGVVDLGDGDNPSHPPTEMVMAQPNCEAAKQNHLSGKFKCENFQHQYMATLHYSTLHYTTLHYTTLHCNRLH